MSVADARSGDPRGRIGRVVLPDSGPAVARLFHAALALVFVVAFASLGRQTGSLFGADGLAPLAATLAQARAAGERPFAAPTIFWLFDAAITTERIEPEFAGFDGVAWRIDDLHAEPGPLDRRPSLVAPHQPRLDFQLWFHGLRAARLPPYVRRLLDRLCRDPARVQPLFAAPERLFTCPPEPDPKN